MVKVKTDLEKELSGGLWLEGKYKSGNLQNPLITIITTTFNSSKTISETFESIFAQEYNNLELIVIDGGSSDDTIKIIKNNDKKIDYWLSERDNGIYDAFNKGLNLAKGDYIGFVNSDDLLMKNALSILVEYHRKYPKIDFIFGSVEKHWGILHGYKPWKINFSWGFYSSHSCGFFIKKQPAKKIGNYDTKFRHHADWDYFYRMIKIHKLRGIGTKKNEIFGKFRRGGFSSKIKFIESILESIDIRRKNGQNILSIFLISTFRFIKNLNKIENLFDGYLSIIKKCFSN